ncbi:hypothetical protein [Archangium violaceum]|uniref:hypothetical protein n=1 Tax=Archangium violaceum TaxID=83451 RepID=UPI001EF09636|nr:hypothetical protein [Archangium violaceum]
MNLLSASADWGSDDTFDVLRLDARRYFTLPWTERHVLAMQRLVELRRVKPAGGLGLRFAPREDAPVNIRLDVAYGSEPGFYLNVGEAF